MDSTPVIQRDRVVENLEKYSRNYQFFKLVGILEHLSYLHDRKKPVGYDALPSEEAVKFVVSNNLYFPVSEVSTVKKREYNYLVDVNFFGLTGPSGVLPNHYLEEIQLQDKDRNTALRDFFDIFNNRSIAFFYRAFRKHRIGNESHSTEGNSSSIEFQLKSLLGSTLDINLDSTSVGDDLYKYIGHYSNQNKNSGVLGDILRGQLGMPVLIREHVPEWLDLEEDDRSSLGNHFGKNSNNCLGVDFVLGEMAFSVESKLEVVIGPINRVEAEKIAPDTAMFDRIVKLIFRYIGFSFQFDIRYLLKTDSRLAWELGSPTQGHHGLGWNTWLGGSDGSEKPDEVLIPYTSFCTVNG